MKSWVPICFLFQWSNVLKWNVCSAFSFTGFFIDDSFLARLFLEVFFEEDFFTEIILRVLLKCCIKQDCTISRAVCFSSQFSENEGGGDEDHDDDDRVKNGSRVFMKEEILCEWWGRSEKHGGHAADHNWFYDCGLILIKRFIFMTLVLKLLKMRPL